MTELPSTGEPLSSSPGLGQGGASCYHGDGPLLRERFYLVVVAGNALALVGIVFNVLLFIIFLSRYRFRHSPMFFLGCVAVCDTLLDVAYITVLTVPILAQYLSLLGLYFVWIAYVRLFFTIGQIFKVASVFSLIVASFERFWMTKHWTFTGFDPRLRAFALVVIAAGAVLVKVPTYFDIIVAASPHCTGFAKYRVGTMTRSQVVYWLQNVICIFTPFFCLVFLNGGIVAMLRRQNVQQLRSLIMELAVGHDRMERQKAELRAATRTLVVIITAYLFSNLLNIFLTLFEYFDAETLKREYREFYRLGSDTASLLTVLGNAIRLPIYVFSDPEIRSEFVGLCCSFRHGKNPFVPYAFTSHPSPLFYPTTTGADASPAEPLMEEAKKKKFDRNGNGVPPLAMSPREHRIHSCPVPKLQLPTSGRNGKNSLTTHRFSHRFSHFLAVPPTPQSVLYDQCPSPWASLLLHFDVTPASAIDSPPVAMSPAADDVPTPTSPPVLFRAA
uniref:G-protein coupled receptors family 1 profile domain-containing protein n=1 Tax=Plectus sambesii TaxID=2011161 RepID=A0A914WIS8_9BILA